MPAYERAPSTHSHVYETGRAYADPPYPYATNVCLSQSIGPPSIMSAYLDMQPSTPITDFPSEVRSIYHKNSGPFLDISGASPEVTSFSPSRGPEHTKIFIEFTSLYDVRTKTDTSISLSFGAIKRPIVARQYSQKNNIFSYQVSIEVPLFQSTSWHSFKVPISLIIEAGDSNLISKMFVGQFEYTDQSNSLVTDRNTGQDFQSSYIEVPKKRKIAEKLPEFINSPRKKTSHQQSQEKNEYNHCQYTHLDPAPSYSYLTASNFYGSTLGPPSSSDQEGNFQVQPSLRSHLYGHTSSASTITATPKDQSSQCGNWNFQMNLGSNISQSPDTSPKSASHHLSTPASLPSALANPPLFRTSTLQQNFPPVDTSCPEQAKQFNTYTMYPNKAILEIIGELGSMTKNWKNEEIKCRRRIVVFKRSQVGSTITASFHPLGPDERPTDNICISCIYWEEKNDYFVTSVDTIFLLQKLVAAQFTVEEKNRIRRNLEGFRPLTVSKGKSESEEFFKVIMAFPVPKPRNIEKDVKVFQWKDLCSALKKIIGKYSASPSSTIAPSTMLLTPISTCGYATESSSCLSYSNDHNRTSSPQSFASSATSTSAASLRLMSPQNQEKVVLMPIPPNQFRGNNSPDMRMQFMTDSINQNPWYSSLQR
ncbi:putative transcriptional regulator medusa [Golovinomyces cichoracearum]|uniref:Putative transcriptional regulator medusa n=1 Tax=Golovinomyces cichoracearum TaxID=62708 RepID=A0A420HL72_9PEZI|nr:putative transcriptional regulator medusa [Golovinomyces cichoracearum]